MGLFSKAGKRDRVLKGHLTEVTAVAFSPDGALLASGDQAFLLGPGMQQDVDSVRLWETQSGRQVAKLLAGFVRHLVFSHDGKLLAAAVFNDDVNITVYDVRQPDLMGVLGFGRAARSVDFSPSGEFLAGGMEDGGVCLIGVPGQGIEETLAQIPTDRKTGKFWKTDRQSKRIAWLPAHDGSKAQVAFSPDGSRLAAGYSNGSIQILRLDTKTAERDFPSGSAVNALDFSPDGKRIASAGIDGVVRLWEFGEAGEAELPEAQQARPRAVELHSPDTVTDVAFSPDGHFLASSGYDQRVRLWSVATGAEAKSLKGHSKYVMGVDYSPDGTMVASCSLDMTVRLWDVGGLK